MKGDNEEEIDRLSMNSQVIEIPKFSQELEQKF